MRDYDPTTGRYLQADPLGLVDGASVYGYALQNALRYVDPKGLQSEGAGPMGGNPNGVVPGGPWKWSNNPGNSRQGAWTNDSGQSASWDTDGSHWDVDRGDGNRQRYDRWGNKLEGDPHQYEKDGKPRVPPFLRRFGPLLFLPPGWECMLEPYGCEDLASICADDIENIVLVGAPY